MKMHRYEALLVLLIVTLWIPFTCSISAGQDAQNQTETFSPINIDPQGLPYEIKVREYNFPQGQLPILQSYVVARYGGKWLIFAGRTNGLHNFTSDGFQNFPPDKQNKEVCVVDPFTMQSWRKSLEDPTAGLSVEQIDSLSTTNTEFYQDGFTLYIAGGYGFDRKQQQFITYDKLTAVDVPGLMGWVMSSKANDTAAAHIRQIQADICRVTGGDMFKMGDTTFLVFGQDFEGPYNPNSNGTYTKQVRSFKIVDNGVDLVIFDKAQTQPVDAYRRRDLNIVPVIRPRLNPCDPYNGWLLEEGLTALSGVFTVTAGAWTVPVEISKDGIPRMANPNLPWTFKQGMNNYHSANLSLFSERTGDMYVLLFGGITLQFYDQDQQQFVYFPSSNPYFLPWTSQITTVRINSCGHYDQILMDEEFPALALDGKRLYFGAEAEFIPLEGLGTYENGVLKLDKILKEKETVIGYIFGGIVTNGYAVGIDGTITNATNQIFEVAIQQRY